MTRRALAATIVSAAWAAALAGCVLPEPIFEEPPPAVPDEGLVIEETLPELNTTVVAQTNSISGDCLVDVGLPEVLDPSGATVFARFFLNLNNPNADQAITSFPLTFEGSGTGGTTDIELIEASETSVDLINLPRQEIDLNNYLPYLIQPTAGSPQPNTLQIFISDGFSNDPTQLWAPASQRLIRLHVLVHRPDELPDLVRAMSRSSLAAVVFLSACNLCKPTPPPTGTCTSDADCQPGFACLAGACQSLTTVLQNLTAVVTPPPNGALAPQQFQGLDGTQSSLTLPPWALPSSGTCKSPCPPPAPPSRPCR